MRAPPFGFSPAIRPARARCPVNRTWELTLSLHDSQKGSLGSPVSVAPSSRYENKPPPPRPLEHRSNTERYGPNPTGRLSPRHTAPPERYGMSPPPTATTRPMHHNLPPASSRPPPSPTPRDGSGDPTLLPLFRAVDKDGAYPRVDPL